jgi:hypothetical protein
MRSSDGRPNLVIRAHSPTRRLLFFGTIIVIAALALYIVYEYGRFNAGYDRLAAAQQRTELEVEIDRLSKSNRELRTHLAELDTIRIGRAREQAEVTRTISDLQAQVAKQTQELAFYRGIAAGTKAQHFMMHVALVRTVRPDTVAVGSVGLSVDGTTADGKPQTLDLPALTAAKQKELPFNFRYFENLDQDVFLPAGFKPEKMAVEVRSNKKDVAPASQSFPWTIDAS